MKNQITLLDKLIGGISTSTLPIYFLFNRNSYPGTDAERILGTHGPLINNPNITPYIGNFPGAFSVSAISGLAGDCIYEIGRKKGNRLLQKIGKYFPEISTGAICTYFTLGESILPQILRGTSDYKDIPTVLMGAAAGYFLAKLGRKSGFNQKCFELMNEVHQNGN